MPARDGTPKGGQDTILKVTVLFLMCGTLRPGCPTHGASGPFTDLFPSR